MLIDRYLCDIDTPYFQPGPFSVRLKYELKQSFFDKKSSKTLHLAYASAVLSLFVVCSLLVVRPHTAQRLNSLVFGEQTSTLDMLLLTESDIDVSNFPSHIRRVSHQMNSSLPFIEEDKSYLLHKFRNHDNKTLIFISEVKRTQPIRTLY